MLLRTRNGLAAHFHLPATRNHEGATVTICGLIGTAISEPDYDKMTCCPICEDVGDVNAILRGS